MSQLKPAGFFSHLLSLVFQKQVAVQVRTETLPNGQVQITPVFTIDGQEVPRELIKPDAHQSILGYSVVFDSLCRSVHEQTQGKQTRLAKKKAGEFLSRLGQAGIAIRSKDGRVQPRIEEVKPDVTLSLGTNDSLAVQSELVAANGVVLDKPTSLDQLKADDGWYSVGNDLLRVSTSDTSLDKVLVAEGGNGVLADDDVPRFLKLLQKESKHIGSVEKNEPLQNLAVFSGKPENRAKVDGTAESVSISPSMVIGGSEGRQYEQTSEDVAHFEQKGGGFRRVSEGWVDVSSEAIKQFRHASAELSEKLGPLSDIQGANIPKALTKLLGSTKRGSSWSSPWAVYFSEAVNNAHRIVDTPAKVEFKLNIVESDGRSLLALDPAYDHERFRLSHTEVENARTSGEEWIRRRGAWIKVDLDKYKKIDEGFQKLNLQPGPSGFTFPASQRERVIGYFSLLGSIQHSEAYAEFLLKLADFEKIEDVPLPATLRPGVVFRPYQKHGYNWLAFLHQFGLNGILADDMGLTDRFAQLTIVFDCTEGEVDSGNIVVTIDK